MSTASKYALYTFDDFCDLVHDGQKADLIDGAIYMASPDSIRANNLNVWLCTLMRIYSRRRDLGNVYVSRVAYRLDEFNSPEPDVGFIRKHRLSPEETGKFDGPPDLAVEIVSPDSVQRDYEVKRDLYETHGVEEYWIFDEFEQQVTLLHRQKSGKYKQARAKAGVLRSKVLPGFYLRPAWCWEDPLPDELDLVLAMLNESE